MTLTGDQFLENLKRRITVPANQVLLNNAAMLDMAEAVMRRKMIPLILSVSQNYFVTRTTQATVANQSEYPIPYRSIGRTLRELKLRQPSANSCMRDMSLIDLEDDNLFSNSGGLPQNFYFQGDKFVVKPAPPDATTYEFVVWYDLQPSRTVQTSAAGFITGISGNVVNISVTPSTFMPGVYVDFVQGRAGNSTLGMDALITNVSGGAITFGSASDLPSDLAVGDWIALAQESPVVQLPIEATPLYVTMTAERVLYALGDFDGASLLMKDAEDESKDLLKILEPRIQGENTKIVNRRGLLRGRGFNSWRWGGNYSP